MCSSGALVVKKVKCEAQWQLVVVHAHVRTRIMLSCQIMFCSVFTSGFSLYSISLCFSV